HGQGIMHYPSGAEYAGAWMHGERHGHGRMRWTGPAAAEYTGDWMNGRMHGTGTYI
ncbi:hypothetical protein BC828DRAFT_336505, partial [Blastocladiella britannica]